MKKPTNGNLLGTFFASEEEAIAAIEAVKAGGGTEAAVAAVKAQLLPYARGPKKSCPDCDTPNPVRQKNCIHCASPSLLQRPRLSSPPTATARTHVLTAVGRSGLFKRLVDTQATASQSVAASSRKEKGE